MIDPTVRLYAVGVGPAFVLMDDNRRPYRAVIVDAYLDSKGVKLEEIPLKVFGCPWPCCAYTFSIPNQSLVTSGPTGIVAVTCLYGG